MSLRPPLRRRARAPSTAIAMAAEPGRDSPAGAPAPKPWRITDDIQGESRGRVLFLLAFLLNVWFFSVPPEIRRTHICTTDPAVAKTSRFDTGCVSFADWRQLVSRHYSTCKGVGECVHFDMSVDPKTLERNAQVADAISRAAKGER